MSNLGFHEEDLQNNKDTRETKEKVPNADAPSNKRYV